MTVRIVPVSLWEKFKLHVLSFIFGVYLIIVRLFKWAWDPKKFFGMVKRDKPPPFLVDNSLGKHSYVKLKGIKFHYVEAGEKDKPLVLLLHGFPDCWLSWREQIPVLSEHYRVVALDLKGFGDSDKPTHTKCYKIDVLIDELHQFILTFGVNQCSIIGHDLGGLLGWYMAALHSEIIYKFVAISSPHPNYYWSGMGRNTFDDKWMHFSRLPFLPEIDALKEDLSIINDTFTHLKINQTTSEKNYVEAYKYAFSRTEDWTGPINYYRNLPFMRLYSIEPISNQTLLIVGNADPSVSLESVIQSSDLVARFNIKVITGAQHFPHQEKPEMVNEVILKFLIGKPPPVEKTPSKGIVSTWLGSLSSTVKYGNQVFDAVHKRTNGVVSGLPNKVLYLGHTTT
ncbi:epoxide hydrolase 4 [Diachasma alloeum]|uniref:epoxide hydrolase 4 n=1 Tax=Diachasma alloeum TaxID=454923 RepID=UPI0007382B32|nr:epoxide hydrolase 4 [Diachasma alloeum]XP_015112325.1 epoxide hydrolase 4 [Diachasma alloeum]